MAEIRHLTREEQLEYLIELYQKYLIEIRMKLDQLKKELEEERDSSVVKH